MRCALALCALLLALPDPAPAWRSDTVKAWSRALGEELSDLNQALTKADQLKAKYKQMNASVGRKDGRLILESTLRSVGTMLTKKINAVKCIHAVAKQLAREFNATEVNDGNFTYCSAKYSNFTDEAGEEIKRRDLPTFAKEESHHYLPLNLERDSHFYNININTDISCVHVPTNIYFKEPEARNAILWSKGLNKVFKKNYQADPSLVWQYFGSAHGILRFYPAMPWNMKKIDTYDCRVQSWYIEAATCSKDVIVLFDVSGSMTGFKNYVARTTLKSLLDTLSNNDYVNVLAFKTETFPVMACPINGTLTKALVQATKENIETIINRLQPTDNGKKHNITLEGNGNLTTAYTEAFKILSERRKDLHCNITSTTGCNQLVMVITDYVPGNLSEVFEKHNRVVLDGKTYTPVRVFTYLIGKEVTNVDEIRSMACSNRGYFVHIHSVEEVQEQVLKYINVIARPMILDASPPPPTWTHASVDLTRTTEWGEVSPDVTKPDEDKLVTSVAIPAFETVSNEDAILLGVAGTDVPIDSIAKLAQPHQLGVNGYSFIVSNNGYLLLHPLLKTSINKELQVNYNSVDFVEVEQVDDGKGARELGDEIKWLRRNLTEGADGNMTNVKVLFHYDDMRRISRVKHDYYFRKLNDTPFSMGISLPQGYGDTELNLKENPLEATQGMLAGINVTEHFRYSYRIHPDWVYCKYHYLEGHESENPEIELWKFLVNISKNEIDISRQQYTAEASDIFSVETHCDREVLDKNDYYCNEDLVKQLVFDAKLSAPYFEHWKDYTDHEAELAKKYNVSVRFIMTSSGLTRWHYLNDEGKNERVGDDGKRHKTFAGKVFGDIYPTTIEETPYKAAVLQRIIDADSLVIATPLPVLDKAIKNPPPVINPDGDITITASYAIFYKDGNNVTPASVVGFQFSYLHFRERFLEITKSVGNKDLECNSSEYDCYLVDSSGYVVLSMVQEEVGSFFGVLQSLVMQSFINKNIFEHVEVFNYQALCPNSMLPVPSSSWLLSTPLSLIKWFLTEVLFLLFDLYHWNQYTYANPIVEDEATTSTPVESNETIQEPQDKTEKMFSCDHSITLYILNQDHLKNMVPAPMIYEDHIGECHPPYWASYVKNANLLLVVVQRVDHDWPKCKEPISTLPNATKKSITSREPCHKLDLGNLPRRRLEGCFTYHEKEANLTDCGLGHMTVASVRFVVLTTVMVAAVTRLLT